MAEPKVSIRVGLDSSELDKGFKSIVKTIKSSAAEAKAVFDIIGKLYRSLGQALKFAFREIEAVVKLAGEHSARTQKQLETISKLWEKLGEQFGIAAGKSSALKLGLDAITTALSGFIGLFKADNTAGAINQFFQLILRGLGMSVEAFLGAKKIFTGQGEGVAEMRNEHTREVNKNRASWNDRIDSLFGGAGAGPQWLKFKELPLEKTAQATSDFDKVLEKLSADLAAAAKNGTALLNVRKPKAKAGKGEAFVNELGPSGGRGLLEGYGLKSDLLGESGTPDAQNPFNLGGVGQLQSGAGELGRDLSKVTKAYTDSFDGILKAFQKFNDGVASSWDVLIELSKNKSTKMIVTQTAWTEALTLMFDQAISAISSMISGIVEILASGVDDIAAAVGQLFGGILKTIGQAFIQLGTVMGILAIISGGATAGPAAALIGGGALLVALGSALSGSGGSASGARTSAGASAHPAQIPLNRSAGVGAASVPGLSDGFRTSSGAPIHNTYNLTFGRTFVAGSPAAVGREVKRMIDAADRLGH